MSINTEDMRYLEYRVRVLEAKLKELEELRDQERKFTASLIEALNEATAE